MGRVIKFERKGRVDGVEKGSEISSDLVQEHYAVALKLSKQILKAWGVRLSVGEIESAAGIALCEAAKRYRPVKGAKFTTYLHYFLKGALSESIGFQCSCTDSLKSEEVGAEVLAPNEKSEVVELSALRGETDIDHEVYVRQIRSRCNSAIASLSLLEKMVIFRVDVLGYKVANLAKEMGYSRGYLSEVRSCAERTLRRKLEDFKQVA